ETGRAKGWGRREDLDAPTLLSSPAHGDRTSRSEAWGAVKLRLWSMHRGDSADFADPPRRIDHKPRMRGAGLSSGCHASDAVASDRDRDDGDADDQEDDRRGGFDEEVGAAVGH